MAALVALRLGVVTQRSEIAQLNTAIRFCEQHIHLLLGLIEGLLAFTRQLDAGLKGLQCGF